MFFALFLSAFAGLLAGAVISFFLVRHLDRLRQVLSKSFLSGDLMERLQPGLEKHVDRFLQDRLPEALPMIAMLAGEKTLANVRRVFLEELKMTYPEVMQEAVLHTQAEPDSYKRLKRRMIGIACVLGIVAGLAGGLITWLVSHVPAA